VRGVRTSLQQAVAQPDDLLAREQMMLASLQAGMAFSNASLGATHAMAHSLGGYLDLAHGECNALLLPAVVDFNFHASEDRFIQIGEAMGLEMKQGTPQEKLRRIMDDIHALRAAVGVEGGLSERGVSRAVVADLADHALNDSCIYTNPRRVTASDLRVIYAEAL
jgi:alcohol dehydrogenase class IV